VGPAWHALSSFLLAVVPVSVWARSIADLEGLIGQLYPAILIARVVSLQFVPRCGPNPDESGKTYRGR
jgi:hypothetical protein